MDRNKTKWTRLERKRLMSVVLAVMLLCSICCPGGMLDSYASAADESDGSVVVETTATPVTTETPVTTTPEVTVAPVAEETTETTYLDQIAALQAEADALTAESEGLTDSCASIYDRTMAVWDAAQVAWEASEIDDATMDEINTAATAVLSTLTALGYDPYATEELPDWGDGDWGDGGGNELDASKYNSGSYVYYDTMTATFDSSGTVTGGAVNTDDRSKIVSVQLNSTSVVQGDSNSSSWSTSGATQLSTYFSGASANNMTDGTLVITPAAGYYVSAVVIGCTSRTEVSGTTITGSNPYRCNTWAAGNAFTDTFEVSAGGAQTIDLSSLDFSHASQADAYFILIAVSKIPTPAYVEYDYGTIVTDMGYTSATLPSTSKFASADAWTDDDSRNTGGTTGTYEIETSDTQFKYAYDTDTGSAAGWEHYANSITDEALEEAAGAGYYFTGWDMEYYNTITRTAVTDPTYNNYTYVFSDNWASGSGLVEPGTEITVLSHMKLTAQWAPVELNVTKTVSGLTGSQTSAAHTYTLYVQKLNTETNAWDAFATVEISVTGNGSETQTLSAENGYPITAGTYRVIEDAASKGNLTDTTNNTSLYINVTEGGQVSYTVDAIKAGTQETQNLEVTNAYSTTPPAIKLVKKWVGTDGSTALDASSNTLPAVTLSVSDGTTTNTYTLTSSNYVEDENAWVMYVPANAYSGTITVTEPTVPTGYALVGVVQSSITGTTVAISGTDYYCTNAYTATNKLDTTTVTVNKTVAGNMGDRSLAFAFTATLSGGTMTPGTYPATDTSVAYTVAEDGKTTTFSLKHGEKVEIKNVPLGSTLTVTESYGSYSVYFDSFSADNVGNYTADEDCSKAYDIDDATGETISVYNYYNINIETGVFMDSLPYILMLGLAVVGTVALLIKRKRSYE